MAPKKKPLLDAYIRTEFGDVLAEGVYADPERVAEDVTYVPGFSEARVARDKALAEVHRGERDQKDVPELPVNLRWVRRADYKGNPDARNQTISANMGYELVNSETVEKGGDVGKPWLTKLPQGAQILPGGQIVKNDTVLMKCDKKKAAQNSAENFKRMAEMNNFEFEAADTTTPGSRSLSAMGGSVEKIKADGPINIKETGRIK